MALERSHPSGSPGPKTGPAISVEMPQPSRLLTLPTELQTTIYEMALVAPYAFAVNRISCDGLPGKHAKWKRLVSSDFSLTQVCTSLRRITSRIFYSQNTFQAYYGDRSPFQPDLDQRLVGLGYERRFWMRSLHLFKGLERDYYDCYSIDALCLRRVFRSALVRDCNARVFAPGYFAQAYAKREGRKYIQGELVFYPEIDEGGWDLTASFERIYSTKIDSCKEEKTGGESSRGDTVSALDASISARQVEERTSTSTSSSNTHPASFWIPQGSMYFRLSPLCPPVKSEETPLSETSSSPPPSSRTTTKAILDSQTPQSCSSSPPPSPPPPRLFALPLELQLIIYEYVLLAPHAWAINYIDCYPLLAEDAWQRLKPHHVALTHVCRDLRPLTSWLFYSKNRFQMSYGYRSPFNPRAKKWLAGLGFAQRFWMREVRLFDDTGYPRDRHHRVLERFPSFQEFGWRVETRLVSRVGVDRRGRPQSSTYRVGELTFYPPRVGAGGGGGEEGMEEEMDWTDALKTVFWEDQGDRDVVP